MINFLKYRWLYFLISSICILIGLFSIFKWRYNFSIEFTGGTIIEYQLDKKMNLNNLKNLLTKEKIEVIDMKLTDNRLFLKTKPLDKKIESSIKTLLEKNFRVKTNLLKSETIGPTIGEETIRKTIIASFLAILGILIYISFAFHGFKYALSAVLAMIHDFLILMGSYSLISHFFNAQFDTMFVTAVLTTMSFSVHDTIVIFDKIREYIKDEGKENMVYFANKALTETMVRSINNSMTIIFMLLALTLLGGSTIRFFSLALLIGTVTGTYSSPFVATPIFILLSEKNKK
ncbi:MAG: protein translocase subunit SecF [Microgenomates group bacterium]